MFLKKYIPFLNILGLSFLIIIPSYSQPLDELLKKILKVDESINSSKFLVKKAFSGFKKSNPNPNTNKDYIDIDPDN